MSFCGSQDKTLTLLLMFRFLLSVSNKIEYESGNVTGRGGGLHCLRSKRYVGFLALKNRFPNFGFAGNGTRTNQRSEEKREGGRGGEGRGGAVGEKKETFVPLSLPSLFLFLLSRHFPRNQNSETLR